MKRTAVLVLASLLASLLPVSFANAELSTSYIIVHTLTPEGVEIASIEGMSQNCVEIYDGDTFIGYGAHNAETHNKRISLSAGQHTIKARFNGITEEQIITLDSGQTKALSFTFERTEHDVRSTIQSFSLVSHIEGSWDGILDPGIGDFKYCPWNNECQTQAWFWNPVDPGTYGTFNATTRLNFRISGVDVTWDEYLRYDAYMWRSFGDWTGKDPRWHVLASPQQSVAHLAAPADFDKWFVQHTVVGIKFSVNGAFLQQGNNLLTLVDARAGFSWGFHFGVNSGGAYGSTLHHQFGSPYSYIEDAFSGTGKFSLAMSSVPYDLLGTGLKDKNQPPIANFTYAPEKPLVGGNMTFDASSSFDQDGIIEKYEWDFGDNSTELERIANHTYSLSGNYTVTLTVTDDEGANTSKSEILTIKALWTFAVYIDGDNDLETAGIQDFMKMSSVGSTSQVNIVAQMDRIRTGKPDDNTSYGDWTDAKRFYISKGLTPTPANAPVDLGEVSMGDPSTLKDFVNWATSFYPAVNYCLVLDDHGSGAVQGVCIDDDPNRGDWLTLPDLSQALSQVSAKPTLIFFDACVMGMLEVAYQIKDYTQVIVGSEEIAWPGPYDQYMNSLTGNPSQDAKTFAVTIVNKYMDYCNVWGAPKATMSAIDLSKISTVVSCTNILAQKWLYAPSQIRNLTEGYEGPYRNYFGYYADLYHFAQLTYGNMPVPMSDLRTAASNVMLSIGSAVFANRSRNHPNSHGLSIFFPDSKLKYDLFKSAYKSTSFAVWNWDEFLERELYKTESKLTLNASPNPISRGNKVTFTGYLTPGLSGQKITIGYRNPSTGGWQNATTLTTGSSGYYSWTVTVPTNSPRGTYDFIAYWSGNVNCLRTPSLILKLTVT